ncbi:MAG: acetate kinase [Candidatus Pacearchaeota archaeon]|nr:acetate kinase [Candidatus Pacearchaeota archaeon]
MKILIFNVGSETLKYSVYENRNFLKKEIIYTRDYKIVKKILKEINPTCIIHRVVHGGELNQVRFIDKKVIKEIEKYSKFAPLHNPYELEVIKLCQKYSKVKQIAVFDTSFFVDLPEKAKIYALPLKLLKKYKIRRYGFHGLNHEYIARKFPDKNIISCHLGSGCSIAAISKGKALDISMGMTPLEGSIMVTRSGSIDPGIVLWLVEEFGLKKAKEILNFKSGLYGLTGLRDVKKIVDTRAEEQNALALEAFCYNIAKIICSYQAALGNIDLIVFSGGIGEANEWIRNKICSYLPFKFAIAVIKANEEEIMLEKALELIS